MYKNLNLNRDLIIEDVNSYMINNFTNFEVSNSFLKKGKTRNRLEIKIDNKKYFIDFHFNKNGSCTIETYDSREEVKKFKESLADYIINKGNSLIGNKVSKRGRNAVFEDIKYDEIKSILQILEDDRIITGKEKIETDSSSKIYRLVGPQNDSVTLSFYGTKKGKVLLQGRELVLYYELFTYLIQLIDANDISEIYNNKYGEKFESNIENLLKEYFPNSYSYVNTDPLNKLLVQSIYNLSLKEEYVICYDGHVLPAIKAFEGFIKIILYNDFGICIPENKLPFFKKEGGRFYLNEEDSSKLPKNVEIYINKCYNYYSDNRHSLVHYDSPNSLFKVGESTRTLTNKADSDSIIKQIFTFIEEYYSTIRL